LVVFKPNQISEIRNIISIRNFKPVQDSEFTIA
jgi:hypothetical protein